MSGLRAAARIEPPRRAPARPVVCEQLSRLLLDRHRYRCGLPGIEFRFQDSQQSGCGRAVHHFGSVRLCEFTATGKASAVIYHLLVNGRRNEDTLVELAEPSARPDHAQVNDGAGIGNDIAHSVSNSRASSSSS